jgi:hypothetical protein
MSATDVDDPSASLVFLVGGVANGRFELAGASGVAITSFTQAQLAAGQVRFVHTDYDNGPSFSIFVTDGAAIAGPGVAVVSFRAPGADAPPTPKAPESAPEDVPAESSVLATSGAGLRDAAATAFLRTPPAGTEAPPVNFVEALPEAQVALAQRVRTGVVIDTQTAGSRSSTFIDAAMDRLPTGLPKLEFGFNPARHNDEPRALDLAFGSARITGMALSVGAVWWAARAGGLLASMLASAPAWRHVDPLPVLGRDEEQPNIDWGEPEKEPSNEDEQAAEMFDGSGPQAKP